MTSRGGVGVESVRAKQAHYERFCASHPLKTADVSDVTWRYIDCGAGARTVLMIHAKTICQETSKELKLLTEADLTPDVA